MTAKEYLNQAYELDRKADLIIRKADAMRKSLYGRGQTFETGNNYNSSGDGIAKAIEKVADYERQADEIIDKLVDKRIEIEKTIALVPDPIQREVLENRYFMFMPFESGYNKRTGKYEVGIDEKMGFCARQIYRYHNKGLKEVSKIIKNVSECQ